MKEMMIHRTELIKELAEATNPRSYTRQYLVSALKNLDRLVEKLIDQEYSRINREE